MTIFLTVCTAGAQEPETGNNYYFNSSLIKSEVDDKLKLNKNENIDPGVLIRMRNQIKITNITKDRVYFKYLLFKSKSPSYEKYNFTKSGDEITFSLSKADFKELTEVYYNRFRGFKFGAYSIPIRLRNSKENFEFDANLSLGANIISRFSYSRFNEQSYIDLSLGFSITKVNLNKENSSLGQTGTDYADIDVLSPAALTLSVGALVNLSKAINIGVYWGWDRISSADQKANWIYNKKPWLGIGFNVSFTGEASKSNSKN